MEDKQDFDYKEFYEDDDILDENIIFFDDEDSKTKTDDTTGEPTGDEDSQDDNTVVIDPKDLVDDKNVEDNVGDNDSDDDTTESDSLDSSDSDEEDQVDPTELNTKISTLKELGYLYLPNDYEVESLEKAIADSETFRNQAAVQSLWDSIPEEGRPLLEYFLNGGKDINSFTDSMKESFSVESSDMENENHQKQVLELYYREKGFSDAKISKLIERASDSLELEDDARSAKEELVTLYKEKQDTLTKAAADAEAEKKQKAKDSLEALQRVANSDDELYGYSIGKKARTNALDSLVGRIRLEDGSETTPFNHKLYNVVLSNPKLTLALSDILNRVELNEKTNEYYFNLSNIQKAAETKATKNLEKSVDKILESDSVTRMSSNTKKKSSRDDNFWDSVII